MGFFDRLSRLLRANLNDLVGKAEDPVKILDQSVEDMQADLVKLRQAVAIAISSQKRLRNQANSLDKKEGRFIWRKFFLIRDAFASLGPASVLTVHRSQGSTFGEVFIASDVFWPKDINLRKQLVYVAVSRAKKAVWLVGNDDHYSNKNSWRNQILS